MMNNRNSIQAVVAGVVIATVLTACGKGGDTQSSTSKSNEADNGPCAFYKQNNAQTWSSCKTELTDNSDTPNPKTPDSDYTKIISYADFLYVFANLDTRQNTDYASIAESISKNYRNTSDSFAKQDIVQQLKPSVDQKIAEFKGKKYFSIDPERIGSDKLSAYNFETKSFKNTSLTKYWRFWDSNLGNIPEVYWMNDAKFENVRVDDYETAKRMESLRVAGKLKETLYMYVNNADMRTRSLYAYLTKIVYTDPAGNIIFTQFSE